MTTATQPTDNPSTTHTPDYAYGEKIAVTVTGHVTVHDDKGFILSLGAETVGIPAGFNAEVRRVEPAEGVPQAGDVWRDKRGEHWFCTGYNSMRDSSDFGQEADLVNQRYGPLTLVYRPEPASDGA